MSTRSFNIDASHSQLGFSVRHLVIAKVRGEFTAWTGTIELDEQDVSRSSVKVDVDIASINTREDKRDAHLRSADFFDAEGHPKMTFVSKQVLSEGGKVTGLIGDLTIRGTTRQVSFDVEDEGRARDPWGGERIAFSAKTRINRQDFGLKWNAVLETGGVVVSDNVDISLEVEAVAAQQVSSAVG